jgi:hypothetical protein
MGTAEIQTFTVSKHKEETIQPLKEKQKFNRIYTRITCEHGGKNLDKANYCWYHSDKCKLKP